MLWVLNFDFDTASTAGYFFPAISTSGSVFSADLFDMFRIIDLPSISWTAIVKSVPTMVSLTAFSLIHGEPTYNNLNYVFSRQKYEYHQ